MEWPLKCIALETLLKLIMSLCICKFYAYIRCSVALEAQSDIYWVQFVPGLTARLKKTSSCGRERVGSCLLIGPRGSFLEKIQKNLNYTSFDREFDADSENQIF